MNSASAPEGMQPSSELAFGTQARGVGPAQSSSRAYLARLAPHGESGELFGLYATTGRAISFLVPALFTMSIAVATPLVAAGEAQRWES